LPLVRPGPLCPVPPAEGDLGRPWTAKRIQLVIRFPVQEPI
jgi:hypothetical protein